MDPTELRETLDILKNAGYLFPASGQCPVGFLCIVDPTCIWIPLREFIKNAWIILSFITGILLAGWGATLLRGAKHDMVKNLRTLVLIFGSLSVALPVVDLLGRDTFTRTCKTIQVSQEQVHIMSEQRKNRLHQPTYEYMNVQDSFNDNESDNSYDDGFNF